MGLIRCNMTPSGALEWHWVTQCAPKWSLFRGQGGSRWVEVKGLRQGLAQRRGGRLRLRALQRIFINSCLARPATSEEVRRILRLRPCRRPPSGSRYVLAGCLLEWAILLTGCLLERVIFISIIVILRTWSLHFRIRGSNLASWGTIFVILGSPGTPNRTPWGPDEDFH